MAKSKIIVKTVKVNERYESFIKEISGEDAVKEDRLFKYQHMLMRFAATLGYRLKEKENLNEGKSYDMVIRRVIDQNQELTDHINMIALADSKNKRILEASSTNEEINTDERYKIYQEYLNGGLKLMSQWANKPGYNYENIFEELRKRKILNFPKEENLKPTEDNLEGEDPFA